MSGSGLRPDLATPVAPPAARSARARPLRVWLAFGCVMAAASAATDQPATTLSGRAMGTQWTATFRPADTRIENAVLERAIVTRLEELEQIFSTYRRDSVVSRFNASSATGWQPVPAELATVAAASREISALTGGAFDVTIQPLLRVWGFSGFERRGDVPSASEIAAARQRVGWQRLEAAHQPPALRKTEPAVAADFSSMAKGFVADAVSELLTRLGAGEHLVQIGGDTRSGAARGDGRPWRVGIESAWAEARDLAAVVKLQGDALSTSGNYRNFFEAAGRRYGHILDPRTGRPVGDSLVAVTVVHVDCASSSAWATALFVLGSQDGWRLARAQGLAALFQIVEHGALTLRATPEFERRRQHVGE